MDAAEKMIMDNLKWRKERNMDGIHTEDWSDMESLYPYIIKGLDKEGKPCKIFFVILIEVKQCIFWCLVTIA